MQSGQQLFTDLAEHKGQILGSGANLAEHPSSPSLTSNRGTECHLPPVQSPIRKSDPTLWTASILTEKHHTLSLFW